MMAINLFSNLDFRLWLYLIAITTFVVSIIFRAEYRNFIPRHGYDDRLWIFFRKKSFLIIFALSLFLTIIYSTLFFPISDWFIEKSNIIFGSNFSHILENNYFLFFMSIVVFLSHTQISFLYNRALKFSKKKHKKIPFFASTFLTLPSLVIGMQFPQIFFIEINYFPLFVITSILFLISFLVFTFSNIFHYRKLYFVFSNETYSLDIFEYNASLITKKTNTIYNLIEKGEGLRIEAKSTLYHDLSDGTKNTDRALDVIKAIAGFLNNKGGTLLIGVEEEKDNRLVVNGSLNIEINKHWKGSEDAFIRNGFSQLIKNTFRTNALSLIEGEMEKWEDSKFVFIIKVKKSPLPILVGKPFFKTSGDERYFFRQEARTIELKGQDLTDHLTSNY